MIIFSGKPTATKWTPAQKSRYEKMGYIFTNYYDEFLVRPEDLPKGSRLGVYVICPRCKQERQTARAAVERNKSSMCQSCANIERFYIDLTGKRFERLVVVKNTLKKTNNRKYIWLCKCDCGSLTKVCASSLSAGNTKSCGCYRREISSKNATKLGLSQVGNAHPRWDDSLTDEERFRNRDHDLKKWRTSVFVRDNRKCVVCGSGQKINAHHIYSYASYPDRRYDMENGITLCKKRHVDFHSKYGYGNNDAWQSLDHISKYRTSPNLRS